MSGPTAGHVFYSGEKEVAAHGAMDDAAAVCGAVTALSSRQLRFGLSEPFLMHVKQLRNVWQKVIVAGAILFLHLSD